MLSSPVFLLSYFAFTSAIRHYSRENKNAMLQTALYFKEKTESFRVCYGEASMFKIRRSTTLKQAVIIRTKLKECIRKGEDFFEARGDYLSSIGRDADTERAYNMGKFYRTLYYQELNQPSVIELLLFSAQALKPQLETLKGEKRLLDAYIMSGGDPIILEEAIEEEEEPEEVEDSIEKKSETEKTTSAMHITFKPLGNNRITNFKAQSQFDMKPMMINLGARFADELVDMSSR